MLFGDRPLDQWPTPEASAAAEPWASFVQAREHKQSGQLQEAIKVWRHIAADPGIESRHVLQAWHLLRSVGVTPGSDVATTALAAVAEVAVGDGHDLLVAYRDGTVRYLNWSGKVAVVESNVDQALESAVKAWLDIAQTLATVVGVWGESRRVV